MEKGLSEQSKQLRRHLLNHNAPDVMKWMQESGMADPVGMIIEMTDDIGKQLTYAALEKQGVLRHEISELIASYCKNAIPTFKCVVSFETAKKILPITSKTSPPHENWVPTGLSSVVVEIAMRRFRHSRISRAQRGVRSKLRRYLFFDASRFLTYSRSAAIHA